MPYNDLFSSHDGELKHVVTVNSEVFVYAHEQSALDAVMRRTVNTIDGRIVQLLCSLTYPGRRFRKLSGSDFIYDLAHYAEENEERVFLLGAQASSNNGAVQVLKAHCPSLAVDGYSPPFCPDVGHHAWNSEIFERIARFRPKHLVVCFGPVKQELWVAQNAVALSRLGVQCAYGLGGTLDFVSGTKRRAPKWVQAVGSEWLFRLLSEPKARFRRTLRMFKMPLYVAVNLRQREILDRKEVFEAETPWEQRKSA